jgi:endonuclease YncB( thermonuclease family)
LAAPNPDRSAAHAETEKRRLLAPFLFLACIFPASAHTEAACPSSQLDEIVRVSYVHDGDTIRLADGRKVRLIGINAPELARDDTPEQAFALEARDALKAAISSHNNRVGLIYGTDQHDRYKRTLAHLFTPDGINLQAQLLLQGMAAAITHPPNIAYSECYARQEKSARCQGLGIWSNPGQAILDVTELDAVSRGFRLVTGKVEHISQTGKGIRIFMSELMLDIHDENLADFDQAALLSLRGKQLTARGWLQPKRGNQTKMKPGSGSKARYYMRIRHPSSIEITPPGEATQC